MKTEQIFQEFEQRLEKEYYAQLASKEILTVPLLIEIFLDDDYANAHWAEQVLEYICEVNPKLVYPFFEFVAKGLDNCNGFLAWNTWKMITKLLPTDTENKFESVKERFYDALASKTPAEFSIACDCAVSVFINKADEQKKLLDILKKSAEHKFYIGDTEIENSGEQLLTDIIPLKQTLEKHGFQESALRGDFYVKKKKKSTVLKRDKDNC